jgi:hypothetical protein
MEEIKHGWARILKHSVRNTISGDLLFPRKLPPVVPLWTDRTILLDRAER